MAASPHGANSKFPVVLSFHMVVLLLMGNGYLVNVRAANFEIQFTKNEINIFLQ